MISVAFFDTKPYDKIYFDPMAEKVGIRLHYIESKLHAGSAVLARGCEAVCAFVNDDLGAETIEALCQNGVRLLALRCAGYNHVDRKAAAGRLTVVRVPDYSPHAVAEHAMALLLTLNRKTHRAYNRTRDYNFHLNNLMGMDLHGKTVGIIGTGRIGRTFMELCRGFGMRVLAYDPHPAEGADIPYVSLERLCCEADVISLHCPLIRDTYHLIRAETLGWMKPTAILINTSRGALIHAGDLLEALRGKRLGGAGLDVYEEETALFHEDFSDTILSDEVITGLLSMPNVLVTAHQAFFTREAMEQIAAVTLKNIRGFFQGEPMQHEVRWNG